MCEVQHHVLWEGPVNRSRAAFPATCRKKVRPAAVCEGWHYKLWPETDGADSRKMKLEAGKNDLPEGSPDKTYSGFALKWGFT